MMTGVPRFVARWAWAAPNSVYAFITRYDNPRFPIVDVERQIVFGVFNFRRKGTVKDVTIDGRTYPMMPSTQWPNEVLNTQAWKFVNG